MKAEQIDCPCKVAVWSVGVQANAVLGRAESDGHYAIAGDHFHRAASGDIHRNPTDGTSFFAGAFHVNLDAAVIAWHEPSFLLVRMIGRIHLVLAPAIRGEEGVARRRPPAGGARQSEHQ